MSDAPRLGKSIFSRLLAVMMALALAVPLLVGSSFVVVLLPQVGRTLGGLYDQSAELMAASQLTAETARQAAARHEVGIRYVGPSGAWATEDGLPAPADVAARLEAGSSVARCGDDCRVARAGDGGTYVFVWRLHREARTLHDRLGAVLVVAIIGLIILAHQRLRRALAPLRTLRAGVAGLAAGDLDTTVPRQSDDELGELADAFNAMVGRVREMVHSRDQLLLDVSHELRSPLTRMRVALALWDEGEPRQRLERNLNEMEAMVSELLELERLRAGRGLERGRHDLVEIVRDAVLSFADRPPGVVLGTLPATCVVEVDPDKVRSVINNLLENALRHAQADSSPVSVSITEAPAGVEVRVEDDGPGIPADDLTRIFEPFYRVDRSRSRRTGGYGLGLALCRRVMEAHGGRIVASNRQPRGAAFVLTFAVAGAVPPPSAAGVRA